VEGDRVIATTGTHSAKAPATPFFSTWLKNGSTKSPGTPKR
jgi:hypothetical protein